MNEGILNIEHAFYRTNDRRMKRTEKPYNQKEFAEKVFNDMKASTAANLFYLLKQGKKLSSVKIWHIKNICQLSGMTANELLGIDEADGQR